MGFFNLLKPKKGAKKGKKKSPAKSKAKQKKVASSGKAAATSRAATSRKGTTSARSTTSRSASSTSRSASSKPKATPRTDTLETKTTSKKTSSKAMSKKQAPKTKTPKTDQASVDSTTKRSMTMVGAVFRGRTKFIDVEPKEERDYVVVRDNGKVVSVAKMKSIKKFDANERNADDALVEINYERYGLERRTGVDFETFHENRMSKQSLSLTDRDAFPEGKERFILGSHDKHRVLKHIERKKKR